VSVPKKSISQNFWLFPPLDKLTAVSETWFPKNLIKLGQAALVIDFVLIEFVADFVQSKKLSF